jgi:hypothetical protein
MINMKHVRTYELETINDAGKSFYGKALVHVYEVEGTGIRQYILQSYQTHVADITRGITDVVEVYGTYSPTTLRHIKEFLLQFNYGPYSKREIEKKFMN